MSLRGLLLVTLTRLDWRSINKEVANFIHTDKCVSQSEHYTVICLLPGLTLTVTGY